MHLQQQKKQGTDQILVAPCITPKNQMKTSYVVAIQRLHAI
jgi:hypothetical protein